MPHFCGRRAYFKDFKLGTCWLLCAVLLSSCGQSSPSGYAGSPESTVQTGTLEPLIAPPNSGDRPPAPGTTGAPKTPDGLPALQAKGTNTALFSQKISNEADRIERLENAVQELRNDFDSISPAIVRLVAIESDIQNLIKQLDVLTGNTSPSDIEPIEEAALDTVGETTPLAPPAPQPPMGEEHMPMEAAPAPLVPQTQSSIPGSENTAMAPAALSPELMPPTPVASGPPQTTPAPSTTIAAASPPLPAATGIAVTGIRIGDHPTKVRIVLDVRGKTTYTADLDNQEKILVVELPQAAWNAEAQKTFTSNAIIGSYRTEKSGNSGTMLVLQLKSTASIAYQGIMDNPDGTSRVVIDLTK